jgi:hypothetical protein
VRLLTLKQASCRQTDVVFGNTSLASGVAAVVMAALLAAAAYLALYGRIGSFDPPRWLSAWVGFFLLIFVWAFGNAWRASRRPTNWLLRIQGNEVLIKFRSYQNWRMSEDDIQVIELKHDEIAFVRESRSRQVSRGSEGGVQAATRIDLEIGLKGVDADALAKALTEERTRPGWGGAHSKTKVLDYPVQLEDNVLRIAWSSGSSRIRPGIKRAIEHLGRIAPVEGRQSGVEDFTPEALKMLPEEQQRSRLSELARRDQFAAIRAARELYNCSLSEAKEMVDELSAPSSSSR